MITWRFNYKPDMYCNKDIPYFKFNYICQIFEILPYKSFFLSVN